VYHTHCPTCRYALAGLARTDDGLLCPECGVRVPRLTRRPLISIRTLASIVVLLPPAAIIATISLADASDTWWLVALLFLPMHAALWLAIFEYRRGMAWWRQLPSLAVMFVGLMFLNVIVGICVAILAWGLCS